MVFAYADQIPMQKCSPTGILNLDERCCDHPTIKKLAVMMRPVVFLAMAFALVDNPVHAGVQGALTSSSLPWWFWPLALFVTCFFIGIVAIPAGIGGGTLFVPIIGGFFPFHLDFVRGAGLLVALASALAAGPFLLRGGLASLRLALPMALLASISSVVGAMVGLILPASFVQTALGAIVLAIVALMLTAKKSEYPIVDNPDRLSSALGIHGIFNDRASGQTINWHVHRTPLGLVLFLMIGFLGGLFGIGAGWANVPVLNLVMGVPLKVSAGTSGLSTLGVPLVNFSYVVGAANGRLPIKRSKSL